MINIRDYLLLSSTAETIKDIYTKSSEFSKNFGNIYPKEQKAYLRHFIIDNVPFAFRESPMLFEQIIQYLADKLEICATDIKLIGSAKTGFSLSPPPSYGIAFGDHSDLDFSIIQEDIFYTIETEFQVWVELFNTSKVQPKNAREEYFWHNSVETGTRQINGGFFDTHYIPNYDKFPTIKIINNSLSLIKINLESNHHLKVTKVSARVYKNWETFIARLKLNTILVLNKIKKIE